MSLNRNVHGMNKLRIKQKEFQDRMVSILVQVTARVGRQSLHVLGVGFLCRANVFPAHVCRCLRPRRTSKRAGV
eukprot:7151035-Pyramimonas_sp.AAC.3